jgi:hypothetical protein
MIERLKRRFAAVAMVVALVACAGLVAGCGDECDDNGNGSPEVPKVGDDKSTMQKAGEKTGEFLRTAKDKTSSAAETVKDKSVEAFEATKDGVKDFAGGVKEGYTAKDPKPVEVPEVPEVPEGSAPKAPAPEPSTETQPE